MNKTYKVFVSLLATVFSLLSLILGIVLTNSVTLTFWRMILYDMVFVVQFLSIIWCGLVFFRKSELED